LVSEMDQRGLDVVFLFWCNVLQIQQPSDYDLQVKNSHISFVKICHANNFYFTTMRYWTYLDVGCKLESVVTS
jgi:hypothetical protein